MATASIDNTVKLWSVQTQRITQTIEAHEFGAYTVAFSPDGQTIASGGYDNTIKLWSVTGQLLETFQGHRDLVTSVCFNDDGKLLISTSLDKTAKLWQLQNDQLYKLREHSDWIQDIAFSQTSPLLATVGYDKAIRLWSVDGKLLHQIENTSFVHRVKFSPDDRMLYSGDENGRVGLWNIQTQEFKDFLAHAEGPIRGLAVSHDAKLLATSGDDQAIRLWSSDGALQQELSDLPIGSVHDIVFDQTDQILIAGHETGKITFWALPFGEKLQTISAHDSPIYRLQVSPNNLEFLSAGGNGVIKSWSLEGRLINSFKGHEADIWGIDFSPDGQRIVSGSYDQTVKLWYRNGTLISTLYGHRGQVHTVSFSPDGQWLASAGYDNLALLWNLENLSLDGMVKTGCQWLAGYLENQDRTDCQDRPS